MKKGLWAILCIGLAGANVGTAQATPFLASPGLYSWTTFDFVGQELSTGESINGFFSFVTSGPSGSGTDPLSVSSSGAIDSDRFFLAEASLNYDDGRFMNYAQQGNCADTIGGQVGGSFVRGTPCSSTLAPELNFTLGSNLGFLTGYAGSTIPFDVLVSHLLTGPGLDINGRYGCSGGQQSAGAPADFGTNGNCGGSPTLFGYYTGTLTAAVPEPGTLTLFGLGLGVAAMVWRRRRVV